MNKKIMIVFGLIIFLSLICSVFALTAKIGQGKMVLQANIGDKLEHYILVINDNDVDVNISLSASGDLENYIDISDNSFVLGPGEEKKAYFTIDVQKTGRTESRIYTQFKLKQGNGVGASTTILVYAQGDENPDDGNLDDNKDNDEDDDDRDDDNYEDDYEEDEDDNDDYYDNLDDNDDSDNIDENLNDNDEINLGGITGKVIGGDGKINGKSIVVALFTLVIIILLIILIIANKKVRSVEEKKVKKVENKEEK